ncbi:hypothetical protein ACOMHN_003080 [Nucella lapillus]
MSSSSARVDYGGAQALLSTSKVFCAWRVWGMEERDFLKIPIPREVRIDIVQSKKRKGEFKLTSGMNEVVKCWNKEGVFEP